VFRIVKVTNILKYGITMQFSSKVIFGNFLQIVNTILILLCHDRLQSGISLKKKKKCYLYYVIFNQNVLDFYLYGRGVFGTTASYE